MIQIWQIGLARGDKRKEQAMAQQILLVSGETSFRLMAARFLKAKGFEVTTAINGLDAIHRLEESRYTMVVADLVMPVLGALDMIKKLETEPEWGSYPLLVLLDEKQSEDCLPEESHVLTLRRPVSMEKLHTRIHNKLAGKTDEPLDEPSEAEEVVFMGEDGMYLDIMKDMLTENSCLNRLIQYIHDMEQALFLPDLAEQFEKVVLETLGARVRLWMNQDEQPTCINPNMLAVREPDYPMLTNLLQGQDQTMDLGETLMFSHKNVVMEVLVWPRGNKHIIQLLYFYLKNFIPVLNSFRDRAYFMRLSEQFQFAEKLKHMVVSNLKNVRSSSNDFSTVIGQNMDRMLELTDELQGDHQILSEIEQIAMESMDRLQLADINNQKLYAIIGNLEHMFREMQNALETREHFLDRTDLLKLEEVASSSILDKNWQSSQEDVDQILSDMGM